MTQPWLTKPTEADLAAAVEENLFALFRAMRAIPGCEVVESERLCTHHAFLDNPFFKGVWQARLDPGEVGPAIDSAIAWFKQRRAKDFLWWTGPQTRPLDFVERLLRRGFDGNYEWILQTFTVSNRAQSLYCMAPYLSSIVEPGDDVLDLCCGSGSMSFWFEERGARVTGIDFAPYMIALAREEASRRNSLVEFIQADIFAHDLEQGRYNLVSCFGNSSLTSLCPNTPKW